MMTSLVINIALVRVYLWLSHHLCAEEVKFLITCWQNATIIIYLSVDLLLVFES